MSAPEATGGGFRWTPRKAALLALKIAVSFGLLAFLLSRVDIREIGQELTSADPLYLFLALLTPFVGYYTTSLRWKGLLAVQGVRVRQPVLFRSCMTAIFFNQLLPSTIGGDVVRIYDSWKAGASKAAAVSTIFIDRILGLTALAVFAVIGLAFIHTQSDEIRLVPIAVVLVALALATSVLMVFSPIPWVLSLARGVYRRGPGPISKFFGKLDQAVEVYRGRFGVLARAMGLSLVLQLNVVLMHFLLGLALGIEVSFLDYFYVVPIALFVMLIPLTINGIGVRDGMFVYLLGSLGVQSDAAMALSFLAFAVFFLHGILGGVVLALRGLSPRALATTNLTAAPGGGA